MLVDIKTNTSFTYGQIRSSAMKLARQLAAKGCIKGDKIGILLGNCQEYVVIYFALMQLGAIPVPINIGLHPDEIKFILSYSDVKMVLDETFMLDGLTGQKEPAEDFLGLVQDDDVAAIMFTSGTTSLPKGVVICYRNVIANGLLFAQTTKIPKGSRFLAVFSQAYMGGWYNAMLIPILSQGTVVLDDTFGSQTALNFWDKVLDLQISALWLTPTMMSILLFTAKVNSQVQEYCRKHITSAFVGTAPLSPRLKKDFEKLSGITFYENYGLSETFFITTNYPGLGAKDGSVGTVLPGCTVEIRDDNAKACPVGEEGEICVRSDYRMIGYYKDKAGFVLDDRGFFATGDLGVFDEQGYLFITGRKKDLIIRGGLNISSKQIEDKLMEMDVIAGIACVGVPHNIYGEEVAVVVQLKEEFKKTVTQKEILDFARKNLAQSKYPRIVCFVDEFPKSSTGKIQKNQLRLMLKEKFAN